MQSRARGKPDARNVPAVAHRARQPGQVVTTEIIDSARPQRLLHGSLTEVNLVPQQNPLRADFPKIGLFGGLTGYRRSFVTSPGEHVDRDTADTARRARNNNRPKVWRQAILLHSMNR